MVHAPKLILINEETREVVEVQENPLQLIDWISKQQAEVKIVRGHHSLTEPIYDYLRSHNQKIRTKRTSGRWNRLFGTWGW